MEQVSMISMTRYDRIRFMDTPPALGVSVAQSSISKSPGNSNRVFSQSRQSQGMRDTYFFFKHGSPWVVVRTALPFVAGSCPSRQADEKNVSRLLVFG